MHFCITANYTPQALEAMSKKPGGDRREAIEKLMTAAGGKLVAMYFTIAEGPGAIVIFDAEPEKAMAIAALVVSSGTLNNFKFQRIATSEEVTSIRKARAALQDAYAPAGT